MKINVIYHINRIKEKTHMIISKNAGKAFEKIQHSFRVKTEQTTNWRKLYHPDKEFLQKTLANILNGKRLNAFPSRLGTRQECWQKWNISLPCHSLLNRNVNIQVPKDRFKILHSCFIHYNTKLETTQISLNSRMNK